MRAGHVSWPDSPRDMAHPTSPETPPAFPVPTYPVRAERIDPGYGFSDGHADGFRTDPPDLGLVAHAVVIGGCIAFWVLLAWTLGAFS